MKLRKAVLSDIDTIAELWMDLMILHQSYDKYFTIAQEAEKSYRRYAEENILSGSKYFKVCIDDNNEIAGYILAGIFEYPPVYPVERLMEIMEMAVRKDQRRKGIGKLMLKDVLFWAGEKGITRVECKAATENQISQGFWKKNGFRAYVESLVIEI